MTILFISRTGVLSGLSEVISDFYDRFFPFNTFRVKIHLSTRTFFRPFRTQVPTSDKSLYSLTTWEIPRAYPQTPSPPHSHVGHRFRCGSSLTQVYGEYVRFWVLTDVGVLFPIETFGVGSLHLRTFQKRNRNQELFLKFVFEWTF